MASSTIRTQFHANVTKLYNKSREPAKPVNYRGREYFSDPAYILLHEEEQHLADGLAFLAHTKDDAGFVSAIMMEQISGSSPGLLVTLASNDTPTTKTVEGLRSVLDVVEDYARAGRGREAFLAKLFERVLQLSRGRLLARTRPGKRKKLYLYEKLDKLLENMLSQHPSEKFIYVTEHLVRLKQILVDIKNTLSDSSALLGKLQILVERCWQISNLDVSQSFQTHLQNLGATKDLYELRAVQQIDKIGRYLEICKNFMRSARLSRSRPLFSQIQLRFCAAPSSSQPPGSRTECRVHGEVQLVLFYEEKSLNLPPRCIGSSKSACFLCDLFIQRHGRYHISHTHKHLYESWTVPVLGGAETAKTEALLESMNEELIRLYESNVPVQPYNNSPESLVHLLTLPDGAVITSPTATNVSDNKLSNSSSASTIKPGGSTSTLVLSTSTSTGAPSISVYDLIDLPLLLKITKSVKKSTILAKNIVYIFDLEDINSGQLQVSERTDDLDRGSVRVNVSDPLLDSTLRDGAEERILTFCVYDDYHHELQVIIKWSEAAVD